MNSKCTERVQLENKIMLDFSDMMSVDRIVDLKARDKAGALKELVDLLATSPKVENRDELLTAIQNREALNSTGIGMNTAIPHVKIGSIQDFVIAIGRSQRGIDYDAEDGEPVYIIIMIAANESLAGEYLQLLASLVLKLKDRSFRTKVMFAPDAKHIYDLFVPKEVTVKERGSHSG